jgi:uncharacterized membrane protein
VNTEAHSHTPNQQHDWRAILRTPEAGIFLAGVLCGLCILAWFLWLGHVRVGKAGVMLGVVTAHLTGGRASGVAVATSSHLFSRLETIVLGSLIEGMVVCLFFPAFCLSFKKLIRVPLLVDAMENVHRSARNQRARLLKWGIPGLIAFVWFPFLMTGPVVGSVIGFLIGMRPWVVVAVVMAGTVSAIISWTFIMDQIREWTSMIGDVIPLLVVFLLIAVIVSIRVKRLLESQALRNGAKRNGKDNR